MILTWGARRGTRDEAGPPEKAKVEEGCREASPEIPHRAGRCRRRNYLRRPGDGWFGWRTLAQVPRLRGGFRHGRSVAIYGHTYVNSLHRCCTAANSRRSFATAANMSEEFILSIKFIVLIMVTHNSTLLGTLPPIPTNDSLFII